MTTSRFSRYPQSLTPSESPQSLGSGAGGYPRGAAGVAPLSGELLSLVNPSLGGSGVKTADTTLMSHSR
jgi:hypothetical protein